MNYFELLEKELGREDGRKYASLLKKQSEHEQIFQRMGCLWAPMMAFFYHWIKTEAQKSNNDKIYFNQRDCEPLSVLAKTSENDIYLTRRICGIKDELANTKEQQVERGLLLSYLEQFQLFHSQQSTIIVDSGTYGSISYFLSNSIYKSNKYPLKWLFFHSKNPDIDGFTNSTVFQQALKDIPNIKEEKEQFLTALMDSFECLIPKKYLSPDCLQRTDRGIFPVLKEGGTQEFYKAFYRGFSESLQNKSLTLKDVVRQFWDEYQKARQNKGLLLCTPTPSWSQKEVFLRKYHYFFKGKV